MRENVFKFCTNDLIYVPFGTGLYVVVVQKIPKLLHA